MPDRRTPFPSRFVDEDGNVVFERTDLDRDDLDDTEIGAAVRAVVDDAAREMFDGAREQVPVDSGGIDSKLKHGTLGIPASLDPEDVVERFGPGPHAYLEFGRR